MSSALAPAKATTGFDRFDFAPSLVRGLAAAGFDTPRPIQAETLPAALDRRDVLGLAQTGTGKTAAFALPILQGLLEEGARVPVVLILAPTRELAVQIDTEIRELGRFTKIETATLFGGVNLASNVRALKRNPQILVGCPGRVLDLIQQGILRVDGIDTLVLDEADHMLDMGFLPDLRRILKALPADRQNLLFSATMPKEIRKLAKDLLDDPHVVELAPSAPAESIEHAIFETPTAKKKGLLDHVLERDDCQSAIVFTRTKHRAKRLAEQLSRGGLRAVALQGNMSQSQRDRAMRGFREGSFDVLVATDIAARGIDVAGVDYVVNFDPPSTPETYTHRIGRTGRSEATGKAITFVTPEDRAWLRATERMLDDRITRLEMPEVQATPERGNSNGGARKNDGGRDEARPARRRRRAGGSRANGSSGSKSRSTGGRRSSEASGRDESAGNSRRRRSRSAEASRSDRNDRSDAGAKRPRRRPRNGGGARPASPQA